VTQEITTKAQLITITDESYDRLQQEVAGLTDDEMRKPGVVHNWTVKDVLAHIAGWERMFTGWMDALLRGERPDRPEAIDEAWLDATNARLYEESHDRSPEAVRIEAAEWHEAIMALIERMSEADLFDPERFPLAGGRPIAPWVRGNADEHYDEHREQIAAWKTGRG
jgi:hypothetical protein